MWVGVLSLVGRFAQHRHSVYSRDMTTNTAATTVADLKQQADTLRERALWLRRCCHVARDDEGDRVVQIRAEADRLQDESNRLTDRAWELEREEWA